MRLNKKNIIFLVLVMVMLLIVYLFAVSKSITQYSLHKKLEEARITNTANLKERIRLERKNRVLDTILKTHSVSSGSTQNQLLDILTKESDSLGYKILSFSEPHRVNEERNTTTTFMFELEGNYLDLLKTIHNIETAYSLGHITHVSFEKKVDYRTRKESLKVICFLEVKGY